MLAAAQEALPADVAVCVAAVADWRPESVTGSKIKKSGAPPELKLVQNPDILASLSAPSNTRPRLVVGFAAETENLVEQAQAKLASKGCDWIVANDVSPDESGNSVFGSDENSVHLVSAERVETWERAEKNVIADRLARYIAQELMETAV